MSCNKLNNCPGFQCGSQGTNIFVDVRAANIKNFLVNINTASSPCPPSTKDFDFSAAGGSYILDNRGTNFGGISNQYFCCIAKITGGGNVGGIGSATFIQVTYISIILNLTSCSPPSMTINSLLNFAGSQPTPTQPCENTLRSAVLGVYINTGAFFGNIISNVQNPPPTLPPGFEGMGCFPQGTTSFSNNPSFGGQFGQVYSLSPYVKYDITKPMIFKRSCAEFRSSQMPEYITVSPL